jgi:hypothetical protein
MIQGFTPFLVQGMERPHWQRRGGGKSQISIKEVAGMQRQTLATAVETKDGIVQRIGRSAIFTPKPNFGGGCIKWYVDRPKEKKG